MFSLQQLVKVDVKYNVVVVVEADEPYMSVCVCVCIGKGIYFLVYEMKMFLRCFSLFAIQRESRRSTNSSLHLALKVVNCYL
jgi:hypothetical protein